MIQITLPSLMRTFRRFLATSPLAVMVVLSFFVLPLSAFEGHVVNVTAKIDPQSRMCDPDPLNYWKKHEGCIKKGGQSIWSDEVRALSQTFSNVFSTITSSGMCTTLQTSCSKVKKSIDKARCEARLELLVSELNIVSGRLDPLALLAGADDGDDSFYKLGLSPVSTIQDALQVIEEVLAHSNSTQKISAAEYVAHQIYTYYEKENTQKPACIYDPEEANQCSRDRDREDDKDDDKDEHASNGDHDDKSNDKKENHENSNTHESSSSDQIIQQSFVIQNDDQAQRETLLLPVQQMPLPQEPAKELSEPEQRQEIGTSLSNEPQAATEFAPDISNTNATIQTELPADQPAQQTDPTAPSGTLPEDTLNQEPVLP